jgi:hypothetical protein
MERPRSLYQAESGQTRLLGSLSLWAISFRQMSNETKEWQVNFPPAMQRSNLLHIFLVGMHVLIESKEKSENKTEEASEKSGVTIGPQGRRRVHVRIESNKKSKKKTKKVSKKSRVTIQPQGRRLVPVLVDSKQKSEKKTKKASKESGVTIQT